MRKILYYIFKNWEVKIISILLATSLWLYVGIGQTKNAEFPGGVPLQIKNSKENFVAVTDVERVKIKIVAEQNVWKSLSADSFSAYLDLSGLDTGLHEVKVRATCSIPEVQIVETEPAQVLVSIEPRIEKEIPVNVLIDGQAGDGYVQGEWKSDPANVTVSGAKSIVQNLQEATAKVHLDGQTSDFKAVTKVSAIDSSGKEINSLRFAPEKTSINVSIVKASNVKTVGVKANLSGTPQEGYWISKVEVTPQTVTISVAESSVNKISFVNTAEIDVNNINKNKQIEVDLKPEADVQLLENIKKVKVEIFVSKNQASKEIDTGFRWQNLASSLKVSSVEPSTVKVVVAGPAELLADLVSSEISLIVDLSTIQNPGTYSIDISRSNIAGPTGISVSSIVPSAINVKVDTK